MKNGKFAVLMALLAILVSLSVLLAPFIRDRIAVAERGSNIEARVDYLEKASKESVSRKEFDMMQKQIERIETKVDKLLERKR